jgi:Concanavalin A-like lectin/glucanases superfamily
MATLFFEGFDKGIVFNKLDSNYWTSQYKLFPKYSFGGYLPYNAWDAIASTYVYNSPNGGILPYGEHTDGYYHYNGYNSDNYAGTQYPEFGTPPGFLAFSNININNSTNVEFPTYLQASGFPLPSGDTTYFSMRCLGLESKHRDLSPYPHRHTFFSYNSGNIPQLTVNVVQVTGNTNFIPLNTEYSTLALEIQQNNQTVGYFDLNISQILTRYRIASVYNNSNTILTIADTISSPGYASIRSRWSHLEFAVNQSTNPATLSINLEDINLPVINNDIDIARESWETSLPISGFNFNNLRFYNRTYSSSISAGHDLNYYQYVTDRARYAAYYMFGQNWLLDDIALIDNVGEPSYFLGSSTRVISLVPGANNSLLDNVGKTDGVLDWGVTTSHRKALLSLDNDDNAIEAINSGTIDAISFNTFNYNAEGASSWRGTFNDAVGGIKLYNSARKKYLDTKFVNVFVSGINDPYEDSVSLLLHGDVFPIVDSTRITKSINNSNTRIKGDIVKFGEGSLYFEDSSSYLNITHSDLGNNPFTIECWVYFHNNNEIVSIFGKNAGFINYGNPLSYEDFIGHGFLASTSGITFQRHGNCDKILYFNTPVQTGIWNHVAVVRTIESDLICYLNGVAGNKYNICDCFTRSQLPFGTFEPENQGTYRGTYTLNNLTNKYLGASVSPTMFIGKTKNITLSDSDYSSISVLLNSTSNTIKDYSSNIKSITNNGCSLDYTTSKFRDKSIYIPNGASLSFSNSDDFNFGDNDFTIEFWLYNDGSNTTKQIFNSDKLIISLRFYSEYWGPGTALKAMVKNGNNFTTWDYNPYWIPKIPNNSWVHISLVSFNKKIYTYINGIFSGASEDRLGCVLNTPNNLDINNFTIGDPDPTHTNSYYIDNFRITKGLARYTSKIYNFSPPTLPFGITSIPDYTNINIDDYRITYGVCRYNKNFTPPSEPFKAQRDNYLNIGPDYNVNKTLYQTYQHYMLKNPATNQPWKTSEVNGMILGVKKL